VVEAAVHSAQCRVGRRSSLQGALLEAAAAAVLVRSQIPNLHSMPHTKRSRRLCVCNAAAPVVALCYGWRRLALGLTEYRAVGKHL
jgi:hypothetical protein